MSNKPTPRPRTIRCAIYTRKSTEEGLDQQFNSLDAQREAAEAYIVSQKCEGWEIVHDRYDDGGFSGGNIERPALKRLMEDIEAGKIDCVIVYKVDRLSRSLLDFARVMGTFDKFSVSFVSVTQHFNTTHSMGRLTLNILLSFAQFEREIIGERIRDKLAVSAVFCFTSRLKIIMIEIPNLEFHAAHACNLYCAQCSHYFNFHAGRIVSVEEARANFDAWQGRLAPKQIAILGGEAASKSTKSPQEADIARSLGYSFHVDCVKDRGKPISPTRLPPACIIALRRLQWSNTRVCNVPRMPALIYNTE